MTVLCELLDLWLGLFLTVAQLVFNLGRFRVRQGGQAQGWLSGLWHQLYWRSLNRRISPFVEQMCAVSSFAFQRGHQILACHTRLRAAFTKGFEIGKRFGSSGKCRESSRLRRPIGPWHRQRGRRRWQSEQDAPDNQSFAYQSHFMRILF